VARSSTKSIDSIASGGNREEESVNGFAEVAICGHCIGTNQRFISKNSGHWGSARLRQFS
jgi:hypothetical protein